MRKRQGEKSYIFTKNSKKRSCIYKILNSKKNANSENVYFFAALTYDNLKMCVLKLIYIYFRGKKIQNYMRETLTFSVIHNKLGKVYKVKGDKYAMAFCCLF